MQYTGEACTASNNTRKSEKTRWEKDPNFESEVFVRAGNKKRPDDSKASVWFEGLVPENIELVSK
jgi:hypothetical protein